MGERIDAVKAKAKSVVSKGKEKAKVAANWIKENPIETAIIGSLVFGTFAGYGEQKRKEREEKDEQLRVWDPVQGDYLYTRKPLTGRQKLEFETRVQNGQPRAEALHEMKVLDLRR